jgi:hypothetical protein
VVSLLALRSARQEGHAEFPGELLGTFHPPGSPHGLEQRIGLGEMRRHRVPVTLAVGEGGEVEVDLRWRE